MQFLMALSIFLGFRIKISFRTINRKNTPAEIKGLDKSRQMMNASEKRKDLSYNDKDLMSYNDKDLSNNDNIRAFICELDDSTS